MKTDIAPVTTSSITPEAEAELKRFLSSQYDKNIQRIEQFDEDTATSDVYLCKGDGADVVLKSVYWYEAEGTVPLTCALEVSELLREEGVRLPKVYLNNDSKYVTKMDKGVGVVLEFLSGSHFDCSMKAFKTSGIALGKFHAAGMRVLEHNTSLASRINAEMPTDKPYRVSRASYHTGLRDLLLKSHECTFPKVCAAFRDNIELIDETISYIDSHMSDKSLITGIVHFDFHVNNGLFENDGTFSGFLDIDQLAVDPLIGDVGNTIVSFVSALISNDAQADIESAVKEFIVGYHSENPLPKNEYEKILAGGLMYDMMRVLRSLQRHRLEGDKFSKLYPKLEFRVIPRFSQMPSILGFIDKAWVDKVLSVT